MEMLTTVILTAFISWVIENSADAILNRVKEYIKISRQSQESRSEQDESNQSKKL